MTISSTTTWKFQPGSTSNTKSGGWWSLWSSSTAPTTTTSLLSCSLLSVAAIAMIVVLVMMGTTHSSTNSSSQPTQDRNDNNNAVAQQQQRTSNSATSTNSTTHLSPSTTTTTTTATTAPSTATKEERIRTSSSTINIAFGGNSMLYFNDCPRFVQQMVQEAVTAASTTTTTTSSKQQQQPLVYQDSCLRGGATLTTLWKHGNGMSIKFATPPAIIVATTTTAAPICNNNNKRRKMKENNDDDLNDDGAVEEDDDDDEEACQDDVVELQPTYDIGSPTIREMIESQSSWDFVILNDYTQGPARLASRRETIAALQRHYIPLFRKSNVSNIIFIQTPAYQYPNIKGSNDLGDFEQFSNLLQHGVQSYVDTVVAAAPASDNPWKVQVAPVGEAYRYLYRNNRKLWNKLYSWDSFHPSPHGTWLQACVLYRTMIQMSSSSLQLLPPQPPHYNASWWDTSRVMQPVDEDPLPRPTDDEAEELRRVACYIVNGGGGDDC